MRNYEIDTATFGANFLDIKSNTHDCKGNLPSVMVKGKSHNIITKLRNIFTNNLSKFK